MALSGGFGKKDSSSRGQVNIFPELPRNRKCLCGSEVIRLEFLLGPTFTKRKKFCYNKIWIIMCPECGKRFKKTEGTVQQVEECYDPGKGSLRWG